MSPGRHSHRRGDESPVTAAEVREVVFTATKFTEGYHQGQVDDFLDEIVETLENPGEPGLRPQDVVDKRFSATKFRSGYSQDEVDAFLDRVVGTLKNRAPEPRSEPSGDERSGTGPPPAWGSPDGAIPAWGSRPDATPAWGTPDSAAERLADQVEAACFRTTTGLRTGYDVAEVDGFLDQVVAALRHRGEDAPHLTWREVADRTFFPTRLTAGYEPADVDALLERAARELRRRDGD